MNDPESDSAFKILVTNLDKPFRIFAPGAFAFFLLMWNCDIKTTLLDIQAISVVIILLSIISIGMIVYAIHRTIFLIFDILLIKKKGTSIKISWKIAFNTEHSEQKKNSFYIINASIHLAAMIFEIMILSSLFGNVQLSIVQKIVIYVLYFVILFIKLLETRIEYLIKE